MAENNPTQHVTGTDSIEKLMHVTRIEKCQHGEPVVDESMRPARFVKLKEQLLESFEIFDGLNINDDPRKDMLTKQIKRAKVRIILSYLKTAFAEKFDDELTKSCPDKLIEELENIIGLPDAGTASEQLKIKFQGMSRRVENSERFGALLQRLRNVTSKINADTKTQDYLATEKFRSLLSPDEKNFLLIHQKADSTVDEDGKLLDDKRQHIYKPKVSAVQQQRLDEVEMVQSDLMSEVKRMNDRIESLSKPDKADDDCVAVSSVSDHLKSITNQLHIQGDQLAHVMQLHNGRGGSSRGSSRGTRTGRGSYRNSRTDNTPQCFHCGFLGHLEKDCRIKDDPNTKLSCRKCFKLGHTQMSKKFHGSDTVPKN